MSSNGRAWRLMRLLKLKTPLGFPGNCGCWEGITTGRRVVFNLRIPPFKISEDEFKLNYSLQSVIFIAWRRVIDPHGLKGLVLAYQVYQQCQLNHSLDLQEFPPRLFLNKFNWENGDWFDCFGPKSDTAFVHRWTGIKTVLHTVYSYTAA